MRKVYAVFGNKRLIDNTAETSTPVERQHTRSRRLHWLLCSACHDDRLGDSLTRLCQKCSLSFSLLHLIIVTCSTRRYHEREKRVEQKSMWVRKRERNIALLKVSIKKTKQCEKREIISLLQLVLSLSLSVFFFFFFFASHSSLNLCHVKYYEWRERRNNVTVQS